MKRSASWKPALLGVCLAGLVQLHPASAQPCVKWETAIPTPRYEFPAAYDSLRGRTLLFGGFWYGTFLPFRYEGDLWSWDGFAWTRLADSGPAPRRAAAMAYDRARDRLVLFGGMNDDRIFRDTWEWDGERWSLRAMDGPSPRSGAAMAYDESRGRTVLFGGAGEEGRLGDTWEWNGRAWAHADVPGPSPRYAAGAVYHAGLGEVVLFGGRASVANPSDELWMWNGESWRLADGPRPPARYWPGLAYDRARDRLVVQSGQPVSPTTGQTWEWRDAWQSTGVSGPSLAGGPLVCDEEAQLTFGFLSGSLAFEVSAWNGAAWARDLSLCGPRDRRNHVAAYDRVRDQLMVFGGQIYGGVMFDETWVRGAGDSWSKLAATGPGPRYEAGMAYDSFRSVAVLFGGNTATSKLGDTWEWSGSAWTQRATTGPTARDRHAMCFDSGRGVMVLFGGNTGTPDTRAWEWNGSAWTAQTVAGPSGRYDHAMAYDPRRGESVLFGGQFGSRKGDTWTWNGSAWREAATTGPAPRSLHAMAFDPRLDGIVLFGGSLDGFADALDDTWIWNGAAWAELEVAGPRPLPRSGHTLTFDERKQRLILVGGEFKDEHVTFGDTWELAVYDTLSIARQPGPESVMPGRPVSMTAEALGGGTITYQWKKDGAPVLDDGRISGATTRTLIIAAAMIEDAGSYTLEAVNACGSAVSAPAVLAVLCAADYTGDGLADFADYLEFLNAYDALDPRADLNGDGVVDFPDYLEFLNHFEAGC